MVLGQVDIYTKASENILPPSIKKKRKKKKKINSKWVKGLNAKHK